jgi:phosphoglycerate dehydrogenase-like enzyme
MMKEKVILDPHFRRIDEIFDPADLERLQKRCQVVWAKDAPIPEEEFEKVKSEAFALVTGGVSRFASSLQEMPGLKAIMEVGGRHPSSRSLDYGYCFSHKIRVLSCAPAFGPMVAEMALGMALSCSRDIASGDRAFRTGEERYLHAGNEGTFSLYGQRIGLIGYGGLARSLKPLLEPFHPEILVYDPWLPESHLLRQGVVPVDLPSLLGSCRVIFVLAIPSVENRRLLDADRLALIGKNAVLVLISRAHLVDFDALTKMVAEGRFKAAIDVFPAEPLPEDHPVRKEENAVLSAHRAGSVASDLKLIGRMVVDDLEALLAGLPPRQMQPAEPEIVFRLP